MISVQHEQWKHQKDIIEAFLAFSFLTLKRFDRFFCCFHCWLLTSKYQLGACNLYQSFVLCFTWIESSYGAWCIPSYLMMYPMLPLVSRIYSVFFLVQGRSSVLWNWTIGFKGSKKPLMFCETGEAVMGSGTR